MLFCQVVLPAFSLSSARYCCRTQRTRRRHSDPAADLGRFRRPLMKVHGASTDDLVDGGVWELEVDDVENSRRVLGGRFIGQPASHRSMPLKSLMTLFRSHHRHHGLMPQSPEVARPRPGLHPRELLGIVVLSLPVGSSRLNQSASSKRQSAIR
jgi:hypothetical protein